MTNEKHIIIDGADVSKCKLYRHEDVYSYEEEKFISGCCEGAAVIDDYGELMCYRPCKGQDCYFKQLARKTQEYEELKAENKDLKEKYKWYDHYKESALLNKDLYNKLSLEHSYYRKAIEEIKKACIKDVYKFADGKELRYDTLDDILGIINKAKKGKE